MLGATAPMRHHRTVGGDDDDGDGGQGSHLHRPHHHDRRYAADAVDDDDDSYVDDLETSGGPAKSLPRPPPHHLQQQQERLLAPPVRKSRIPSSSSSSSSSSIPRLSIAIPSASSSSRSYTAAATALTRPPSATSMLEEVERAYQRSKASTTSKGSSAASIKSRASAMPQPPSTPSRPLPQTPSYLRAPRRPATPSSYGAPANFATHARRNSGVPRAQALQAVTVKKRVVGGGPKPANPSSSLSSNARAATTPAKASRPSRPANAPVTTIRKPAAAPASTAKPKSATTTATSRAASTAATVPSARATTPSEVDPSKARAALDAIVADIYGTDGGVDAVVSLERTSAAPEPLEAQPSSSSSTSSSSSKYLAPKNPDFRSPSMSAGPSSPSAPYTRPQQPKAGRASSRPSIYSSTRTAASSPSAASKKGKAPEIGIAAKLRLATLPHHVEAKIGIPLPCQQSTPRFGTYIQAATAADPDHAKDSKDPTDAGRGRRRSEEQAGRCDEQGSLVHGDPARIFDQREGAKKVNHGGIRGEPASVWLWTEERVVGRGTQPGPRSELLEANVACVHSVWCAPARFRESLAPPRSASCSRRTVYVQTYVTRRPDAVAVHRLVVKTRGCEDHPTHVVANTVASQTRGNRCRQETAAATAVWREVGRRR
ncbi:hypothetical protein DFJ73DRAFT_75878 [Zopfochytrium polystomum]|nr:hypothetical protein DFJ73DRAFT_75878 [Zopfochytrium polystomum]